VCSFWGAKLLIFRDLTASSDPKSGNIAASPSHFFHLLFSVVPEMSGQSSFLRLSSGAKWGFGFFGIANLWHNIDVR
jgi:hypothetical protein